MLPEVFRNNWFDDWMDDFPLFNGYHDNVERKLYGRHAGRMMRTDVHEHDDHFEADIDLPGFKKDELTLELKDGYLIVTAAKGLDLDHKDNGGRLIRQERYAGTMQRSFYVGEDITEEDITAKYENGVLHLSIPKKEEKSQIPEKKTIMIE